MAIPEEMRLAAEQAGKEQLYFTTVRDVLRWYKYARRGSWIVSRIRADLEALKLITSPDFESVYIDAPIAILKAPQDPAPKPSDKKAIDRGGDDAVTEDVAPAHRISRLRAANTVPVRVAPTDTIQRAVTLMLQNDFSQLPVMTSDREVKGMISWKSMGRRTAMAVKCTSVHECMDQHHEVHYEASMFEAIRLVATNDCVLVRNREKMITGIVTAVDLNEQFQTVAEPFLVLGDIEQSLRRLIERSFTPDELKRMLDPADAARQVEGVSDLTFGEYVRLLQRPEDWEKLRLPLDRAEFVADLDRVRRIRNDVMHFDPDGISDEDLIALRKCSRFLDGILAMRG